MNTITEAQFRVARLAAAGLPRHEIAARLGVQPTTVDQHRAAAMRRLGVGDRRQLARALLDVNVGAQWRSNRFGWRPGQQFRLTGGRYAGRTATFVRLCNTDQVLVQIGGGTFAVRCKFLEAVCETN